MRTKFYSENFKGRNIGTGGRRDDNIKVDLGNISRRA
jgi:hypothetical protein